MAARIGTLVPLLFAALIAGAGCAPVSGLQDGTAATPILYGVDDRQEVYAAPAAAQVAADSVVALFVSGDVADLGDGTHRIDTSTSLGDAEKLCIGEAFREQPNTARCTGFQVGADLIATAGHCMEDAADCGAVVAVFGYRMVNATTVRDVIPSADVYHCTGIVGRAKTTTEDWAIFRVGRAITGHVPLTLRSSGIVGSGAGVAVIGHPVGLPAKVAANATVRTNSHPDFFEADLDTFRGNSGSPVFNADFTVVEGILVRGPAPEFERVGKGKKACYVHRVCAESGCTGDGPTLEGITRSTQFAYLLGSPPGPCTDDSYEPNSNQSEAPALVAGSYTGLQLCSADEDWYSIWVPENAVLTATIGFSHAAGDLNLELRDFYSVLSASFSQTDGESVANSPRAYAGTMFVRVRGLSGAGTGYDLQLSIDAGPPLPDCGNGTCDFNESCDGRRGTVSCPDDCAGRTGGKPSKRYCYVGGTCEGPGCP